MIQNDAGFVGSIPQLYDENVGPTFMVPYASDIATINQSISKFIFMPHIAGTAFGRRNRSSPGSSAACAWRKQPCF